MMKRLFCLLAVLTLLGGCALAQENTVACYQRGESECALWTDWQQGTPPAGLIVVRDGEARTCRVVNDEAAIQQVMEALYQAQLSEATDLRAEDAGLTLIFVAADGEQIAYRFEDKAYVWDGTHYTLQNADAFWKAVNEIR